MNNNNKILLVESNNSAGKLYTDRQQLNGVVGKNKINKNNAAWNTDIKYGIKLNVGDELTISATQINLRGEPDASMEFSGGDIPLTTQYNAPLVDNIATIEYGYYFTNQRQYNINLPLINHKVSALDTWTSPIFGCAAVEDVTINDWEAFYKSYPAWGLEGVAKMKDILMTPSTTQTPTLKDPPTFDWTTQLFTDAHLDFTYEPVIIDSLTIPSFGKRQSGKGLYPIKDYRPQIGSMYCGRYTAPAISNAPYQIAFPSEKRLYKVKTKYKEWCKCYDDDEIDDLKIRTIHHYITTDRLPLTAQKGFQTPDSVAGSLNEQLHERTGKADNWDDENQQAYVYEHDAYFTLAGKYARGTQTQPTALDPLWSNTSGTEAALKRLTGGYQWDNATKLRRKAVSQVTDKFMKTVSTSTGRLLEKIWIDPDLVSTGVAVKAEWEDFTADIPGNNTGAAGSPDKGGWRGIPYVHDSTMDFNSPSANGKPDIQGNWSVDGDGNNTYVGQNGRDIFYNDLLVGEMGRFNALNLWNNLKKQSFNMESILLGMFFSRTQDNDDPLSWPADYPVTGPAAPVAPPLGLQQWPSYWNQPFETAQGLLADLPFPNKPSIDINALYTSQGRCVPYDCTGYNAPPNPETGSPDELFRPGVIGATGQFGSQVVGQDNWATAGTKTSEIQFFNPDAIVAEATRQTNSFSRINLGVVPKIDGLCFTTNIIATPRSIALIKKALYSAKQIGKFQTDSALRNDVNDPESVAYQFVTELDLGATDDGASINVNCPSGNPTPDFQSTKISLPSPYSIVLCPLHGVPPASQGTEWFFNYQTKVITWDTSDRADSVTPAHDSQFPEVKRTITPSTQNIRPRRSQYYTYYDERLMNPKNGNVSLPTDSQFKFTDSNGMYFKHQDFLRPDVCAEQWSNNQHGAGTDRAGERPDLLDGEVDRGVGIVIVYPKKWQALSTGGPQIATNFPDMVRAQDLGSVTTPTSQWPGTPNIQNAFPMFGQGAAGGTTYFTEADQELGKKMWEDTPFIAFVMKGAPHGESGPIAEIDKFLPVTPPGEFFGFSNSFSDGEYGKIINTQRVNPKAYGSTQMTAAFKETNTEYGSFVSRFNSLYYNVYDYYPYCMIGASDPTVNFGATSGRFEISSLHTPTYVGNGAWCEVDNPVGADEQANEQVAILNGKQSWNSQLSLTTELVGPTPWYGDLVTTNTTYNYDFSGWQTPCYLVPQLPASVFLGYGYNNSNVPLSFGLLDNFYGGNYNPTTEEYDYSFAVIPWENLGQANEEHRVITSQSGIGLMNIYVPNTKTDIPKYLGTLGDESYLRNPGVQLSAWTPNTYNNTLFYKMGFELEQLLPIAYQTQSNSFNRSNYNKFIGYNGQTLLNKSDNMVYPFTTNGYITGTINILGQNRNWLGYDTIRTLPMSTAYMDQAAHDPNQTYQPSYIGTDLEYGNNRTINLKQLPPTNVYEMFSMGGLNSAIPTKITCESDVLTARRQPKKYDFSYLLIHSNIIQQSPNFIGSNKTLPIPAIGYLSRNYSSSDFFYSFDSDFSYTIDKSYVMNNFDIEIRLPNGQFASIEDNSSVIFKITRAKPAIGPIPGPPKPMTKDELTKQEKAELAYYKSLFS